MEKGGTSRNSHPHAEQKMSYADRLRQRRGMAEGDGDLEVPWGLLLEIYQMGIPAK
jgi:hypothetical protein